MSEIVRLLRERLEHAEGPFWEPDRICNAAAAEIECLRGTLAEAQRDLKSECERRDEIIVCITKLWEDAKIALAEARGLLGAFYRADIDPHKYDRTAQWLERNP